MRALCFAAVFLVVGCSSSSPPPENIADGAMQSSPPPDGGSPPDLASACTSSVAAAPGLVVTDRGPVQSVVEGGAYAYYGIPFAAPPMGDLRWKPPADVACWSAPKTNTTFGKMCLQLDASTPPNVIGGEDCLTIDVWAPQTPTSAKLPVLFFVHGGGNVTGDAGEERSGAPLYDGALLAQEMQVVVVDTNYRLGPLGFLANKAFASENAHGSAGNYGLLDQIAALQFVQRNAVAFGGDPAHVMLFGQSGGALDTCALLASPLSAGLYAEALMESGACTANTKATAQTFGDTFAQKVGCTSGDIASCLRNLPASMLQLAFPETANALSSNTDFALVADGYVLPDVPMNVLLAGTQNHVPLVIGSNEDETGKLIVEQFPTGMTEAAYEAALLVYAGNNQALANEVLAVYPSSDYANDPRAAWIAVTSDSRFTCTARYVAKTVSAGQTQAVRRYQYTHTLDGTTSAAFTAEGAFHGQELLGVFSDFTLGPYTASTAEVAFGKAVEGYWTRFAATGDPNGASAVTWPLYDATADTTLVLDETTTAQSGIRTKQCDFWDALEGR